MSQITPVRADLPPSERLRARLLAALLPIAAERGWSPATLKEAADSLGFSAGELQLAAPRGALDMIDAFAEWGDAGMEKRLERVNLLSLKIRERVRAAVVARLEAIAPYKAAEAKAVQAMIRPFRAGEGAGFVWRSADRIWRLLGDRSTDENYYSKRAILVGVLGSTTARWLSEPGDDMTRTLDFLDRRIDNVMQIEKLKAQARPVGIMAVAAVGAAAKAFSRRAPGNI
ncbi:MAG: COQ9 family protein [Hyphomonadaceae bacterium]|nr:MAG: rpsU-divergently transcribed protein [Caulobacteraceae bacterium]MBT9444566.1 COQ9 family protein [Hyphomonadaceae bacterium]